MALTEAEAREALIARGVPPFTAALIARDFEESR